MPTEIEELRATVAKQQQDIEKLHAEISSHDAENQKNSEAFLKVKVRTQQLADAARAILDLQAEHEKDPV